MTCYVSVLLCLCFVMLCFRILMLFYVYACCVYVLVWFLSTMEKVIKNRLYANIIDYNHLQNQVPPWFVYVRYAMFCYVYVLSCIVSLWFGLWCLCFVMFMFVMFMFCYVMFCYVYGLLCFAVLCLCLLCLCFVMFMFCLCTELWKHFSGVTEKGIKNSYTPTFSKMFPVMGEGTKNMLHANMLDKPCICYCVGYVPMSLFPYMVCYVPVFVSFCI